MIVRFVAKNIYSFNDETEFNLLPNKTQNLSHHKVSHKEIEFLRFSAIYGANASGKSNLIKSIALLQGLVLEGTLLKNVQALKYKLEAQNLNAPISLGIEFYSEEKFFYYAVTFDNEGFLNEYLAESKKDQDILIFDRSIEEGVQKINLFESYYKSEKEKLFVEILADKLLQKDELLLTFLYRKYETEFLDIKKVYNWFDEKLHVIQPSTKPNGIAHILDAFSQYKSFANHLFPTLSTGIAKIEVDKRSAQEVIKEDSHLIKRIRDDFKERPNAIPTLTNDETGEEISFAYENDEIIAKRLVTFHANNEGHNIKFNIKEESDGTKRLIDYIPAIAEIVNEDAVYLIDEIERSIHPIIIKELIRKISLDKSVQGQLIFTTHESNLLDQKILRPDEIWFAQKSVDGSSKLYSLSDFKVHNTVDIENGYLKGRYGAIPFLSNLIDLNWNINE